MSTDSREQQARTGTEKTATDAKPGAGPAPQGATKPSAPPTVADAAPDRGPAMMTALPGGGESALPGTLEEKHFADEMDCGFETALEMVEPGGPARERRSHRSIWAALLGMLRLDSLRGPATRQDRHVAFDGFRNPLHDEKIERDRRYGTVYTVVEHANAYLVSIEMPRRIPASSLKELWKLPDEMPDYEYTITLHGTVLAVRAGVRGDAMRRLSYISASFPSDFLTRIEFDKPVVSFKHRLRDKVLEIVVFKVGAEAVNRAA